ncbi:VOC family protein [Rhodococcus sp. BP-349]|uniref:VOC family protein n=1 Tax=unclassified Rhodococcus (in: high G+C Gram-positive bacteria) TaxID=192944 RepID=UPI001C9AC953|nr:MULTISPECIES: VOC family protein [unclassified Rhodococcus (in: high G+C Gram-positive bacteria)]MBY6539757.1 VOC family protein [Rhodococcus sp. BP-363]MBY6543915.1 VOC family protein [Rhodococcus sp. BP-369]MBY6563145.1 VOC family protein [Rhodococcus sp. BP-370]MBY6577437.1 VOC family protein [Rhodococcus sp. BP-364]MBY6586738.1 VOC family protein [Rhodococcus sp. BP-358]
MTETPSTITNIGVAMFTVADQDKALDFYTRVLGFEVRGDTRFGPNEEYRWLEVAPRGSTARLALNPPMYDQPGGSSIGVETSDVRAEHARLSAIGGVDMEPLGEDDDPNVPPMFMLKDPDGNVVTVVQA